MKERLLNIICCLKCRENLILGQAEKNNGEIETGILKCLNCQAEYPIIKYIPRFVNTDKYVNNFSFEWTIHKKTQLDSMNGNTESHDSFISKTGTDLKKLKNKVVLDVGCGMGRYMEIVQPYAREVVGVDLSFAVDSAYDNLKEFRNIHIIQADIFCLPFKEEVFDFVYSIGVLHHTPDTKKAFMKLPRLLKKRGEIAIWVYSNETNYLKVWNKFSAFYRFFTIHIPKKALWYLVHLAIPCYYLKKIPVIGPLFNIMFPMSNHPDAETRVLDTFDWFSAKYQYKHTYIEVRHWFEEANLSNIRYLSFPVALKGEKKK